METGSIRPKSAKGRARSRPKTAHSRSRHQTSYNSTADIQDNYTPIVRPKSAHPRSRSRIGMADMKDTENEISSEKFRIQQSLKALKSKHKLNVDSTRNLPRSGTPEVTAVKQIQSYDRKLQHPNRKDNTRHSQLVPTKQRTESPTRKSKVNGNHSLQGQSLPKGDKLLKRPKTPAPTLQNLNSEQVIPRHPTPKGILKNKQPLQPVKSNTINKDHTTDNNVGPPTQKRNNMDYQETALERTTEIYVHPDKHVEQIDSLQRTATTTVVVTGGQSSEQGRSQIQRFINPYIDEIEYYSNLDPVEYFADTTIRDLPILPSIIKESSNNRQADKHSKPPSKIQPKLKYRPWSEGMAEKEKIILSRKKCINTKNSVYAMFFEENGQTSGQVIDYSRYVAMPDNLPIEDDIAKGNPNRPDVHANGRNQLKVPEADLSKTAFPNNAIQFQQNNKWTSSLPPKYPTPILKNNLHDKRHHYIKNDIKSVLPIHLQKKRETRPFSEGFPVNMTEKEILRFTSNANLYARTGEKVISKYKKTSHVMDRPSNLPTGLEKKPRNVPIIQTNQFQMKATRDVTHGHVTPRTPARKFTPVHATYK